MTPLVSQRPEVGCLWIGLRFRSWPGREDWWTDWATGRVARGRDGSAGPDVDSLDSLGSLDGLVYLPPVARRMDVDRWRWAGRLADLGAAVLVQTSSVNQGSLFAGGPIHRVFCLLPLLLEGRWPESGSRVPRWAVWPLVAGVSDDPETWKRGCEWLARCGVEAVQALSPRLDGEDRRGLLETHGTTGEAYDAVFHRETPSERTFARVAHSFGMSAFVPRPLPGDGGRRNRNRRLAERLALAGEIWLGLGRSEVQAQTLFRAARWCEDTPKDVRAVVREENLDVVEEMAPPALEIAREWARDEGCAAYDALYREYVAGDEGEH